MQNHNFLTKKSLGQHFLIDSSVLERILSYAPDLDSKNVIEIGPGIGNLTTLLLKHAKTLTAIEKDNRVEPYLLALKKQYPSTFSYYLEDALTMDLLKLVKIPAVIIANLPYNIGTTLYTKWLFIAKNFDYFILMFQKEVAQRITAIPKNKHYGRLSIISDLFCDKEFLFTVPPDAFSPKPKVESGVIKLRPLNQPRYNCSIELLEKITATAFQGRRKIIKNTLKNFNFNFENLGINPLFRPDELTLENYITLTQALKQSIL